MSDVMIDNSVLISRAVQTGIPLQLAKEALEKGIDLKTIMDNFNREERPHKWSPHKVRLIKERITRLVNENILQEKDAADLVRDKYIYQVFLLIHESGIPFNKTEDYFAILSDALDNEDKPPLSED